MSKPKIVSDYLEAAVPKGLSASRRKLLTEELEGHIYDRVDAYMQMGYTKEESLQKAIEAMGDAEPVREQFDELYGESEWQVILTYVVLVFCSIGAIFSGFASFLIDSHSDPSLLAVFLSTAFFSGLCLTTLACYKRKQEHTLAAVGVVMGIMSVTSLFTNAVFQPMCFAAGSNIPYLLEKFTGLQFNNANIYNCGFADYGLTVSYFSPLIFAVSGAVLSVKCTRQSKKKWKYILPDTRAVAVILAVFTVVNTAVFFYSYKYYQFERIYQDPESQATVEMFTNLYSTVDTNTPESEIEALATQGGLVNFEKLCAITKNLYSFNAAPDLSNEKEEYYEFTQGNGHVHVFFEPYEYSSFLHGSYVAFTFSENGQLVGKEIMLDSYDAESAKGEHSTDPEKLYEYFGKLKQGDTKEKALNIIMTVPCVQIKESVRHTDHTTEEFIFFAENTSPVVDFEYFVTSETAEKKKRTSVQVNLTFKDGILISGEAERNLSQQYQSSQIDKSQLS